MTKNWSFLRSAFLKASAPVVLAGFLAGPAAAQDNDNIQELSLVNLHTNESLTVTYKSNGLYIPEALEKINVLLRDHRQNETTTINPATLDRLHDIGQVIAERYPDTPIVFEVISGYRSPATNNALRKKGGAQASQSLHMAGDAIDMRVPGISTKALRDIAWCTGSGGTGYYAQDGFVHIDTGRQRFWPAGWDPHQIKCD